MVGIKLLMRNICSNDPPTNHQTFAQDNNQAKTGDVYLGIFVYIFPPAKQYSRKNTGNHNMGLRNDTLNLKNKPNLAQSRELWVDYMISSG